MKVYFRVDGSAQIGLGHLVRCIALAQMLQEEFSIHFISTEIPGDIIRQIEDNGFIFSKINSEDDFFCLLTGKEIVVLDNYFYKTDYQRRVRATGSKLVCIDDNFSCHFVADVLINHGVLDAAEYSCEPYTKLLLGPKFSLLRRPFFSSISQPHKISQRNDVFLCFGGSDIYNLTLFYLEKLLMYEEIKSVHIVVGTAFKYLEQLKNFISKNVRVHLHKNISAEDLIEVIRKCKIAIVPGSTVSYECACVGIGILCGYYVDNQRNMANTMMTTGMAVNVEDFMNPENERFSSELKNMLKGEIKKEYMIQRSFFDGKAGQRFLKEFQQLSDQLNVWGRKAVFSDGDLLFEWVNEPGVRGNAIDNKSILYNEHAKWFNAKLVSELTYIYLFFLEEKELGQVRFDWEDDSFIVDYSICAKMRGRGYGGLLLSKAIGMLSKEYLKNYSLKGIVRKSNEASASIFRKLNFEERNDRIGEQEVIVFNKHIVHNS
jgi:UDP-2,4-diacetamido-2,4,6-trideoxy-beta-L-altropyranose hydrolase